MLEILARLPSPEEVLALRPTTILQKRAEELLEKNRCCGLSHDEQREWDRYEYIEHLVRMAKERDANNFPIFREYDIKSLGRSITRRSAAWTPMNRESNG